MPELFDHPSFDDHEQVLFVSDPECGLRGIIAIHSTVLGPAAGGCRMHDYATTDDALKDVLRLSRGMTMKNAATGIPVGGGKCVIVGDPASPLKESRLRAMARHVQRLGGLFWTAIDVGVGPEDCDIMAQECDYIFARASEFSPDFPPSRFTSRGGFHAVRAAASYLRGNDDLEGLSVAVQGVGQTGSDLIRQLVECGVTVVATDVDDEALSKMVREYSIKTCAPDAVYAQEVDILAPCAMGGILNDLTLPLLKCRAIAGLANNQLESPAHGQRLLEMGIAYAPDFIVNGGGITVCAMPIYGSLDKEGGMKRVEAIYDLTLDILNRSRDENVPTEVVAESMAMKRIDARRESHATSD